ncbi:MAG: DUF58 domain-containing protein [Chloroflexi bacterium]|nr:DUF58 domain-containing protein [Chloroflexota bacterium]
MPPDPDLQRSLLRRLRWPLRRPLAQRPNGDERSRLAGPGIEFAAVREYQPGDDVRLIDWQRTARSGRPYVREAHTDRALDVWLVVDVSPSIDWGTARGLKRDLALELAGVAGQLLGRHGNRVGLVLFADRPLDVLPPAAGHQHLERVLARLRESPARTVRGATDLTAALTTVQRLVRRASVILLVSDFLVPDGWQSTLRVLTRRHEIVALRLHDPREAELPDIGIVTFEDPETGAQLTVDTGDRKLRRRFADAAAHQAQTIDRALLAAGADSVAFSTDAVLLPTLARFLDARRRIPGSSAGAPLAVA